MSEKLNDRFRTTSTGGLLLSVEFQAPAPPPEKFQSTPSNLLPHLATLHHQLLRNYNQNKEDEEAKRRAKFIDLEFLPYSLNAAKNAVENFIGIQEELVREAFRNDESFTGRRHLDDWWRLAYTVDSFLEASVRAQVATIMYWGAARYKCSLKGSLDRLQKDRCSVRNCRNTSYDTLMSTGIAAGSW
jgi:hypothetical protein